jgi:hypothetical protein
MGTVKSMGRGSLVSRIYAPVSDHYEIDENTTVQEHFQQWVWAGSSWMQVVDRSFSQLWNSGLAPEIADLMGARAVLSAFQYKGEMCFNTDIWLKMDTWLMPSDRIPDHHPTPVSTDAGESAYTPERGSPERTAILETLRELMLQKHHMKLRFVVKHLKVKDGWGYLHALPRSEDGNSHYEDLTPLMHFKDGVWEIVDFNCDGGGCGEAPKEIFSGTP